MATLTGPPVTVISCRFDSRSVLNIDSFFSGGLDSGSLEHAGKVSATSPPDLRRTAGRETDGQTSRVYAGRYYAERQQ